MHLMLVAPAVTYHFLLLEIRKQRPRKVKYLVQGHTAKCMVELVLGPGPATSGLPAPPHQGILLCSPNYPCVVPSVARRSWVLTGCPMGRGTFDPGLGPFVRKLGNASTYG